MYLAIASSLFMVFLIGIKFLKVFEAAEKPKFYHSDSQFIKNILLHCKHLHQVYTPPLIWGRSGHVQTAFYGKIGRWNSPSPSGNRHVLELDTGETMSYDKFQPTSSNNFIGDCTILVCPGLCNSSEKKYVRTFVHYAMDKGFRVFVLNHIGTLPSIKLTSPKIFTYGETKYFARMAEEAKKCHPSSVFAVVGFSMGGNIVARYLGEDASRQNSYICGVSVCQGYDVLRASKSLNFGIGRVYNYLMASNFKQVLKPHWKEIFHLHDGHIHKTSSSLFDEHKVESATSLQEIEDGLLRHFNGFSSSHEYRSECGCEDAINNIDIPLLLINSEDDPIVENDVHDIPRRYSQSKDKVMFISVKHGGHLGFFKGGWWTPNDVTLIEDYVIEYIEAVLAVEHPKGRMACVV